MNVLQDNKRNAERGGARVKLLIMAVVIGLVANAGYNFVPVAFQGENFKQDMETAVIQGVSMPSTYGTPINVVRFKVGNAARVNQLPHDAVIDVKEKNNIVVARVYYMKKIPLIPFGIYDYEYVFDHSATPGGFLSE